MWKDPIVEETRKIRDELAAKFNYDIDALGRYYSSREKSEDREVVSRPAKPITAEDDALVGDRG